MILPLGAAQSARREIDARDQYVLPGGVDPHVHLSVVELKERTVRWADDFLSGSKAAIAGGVTTIGNVTFPRLGESLQHAASRVATDAARDSLADFVLHMVIIDPGEEVLSGIPSLAQAGHMSIKVFMTQGTFDRHISDYLRAIAIAGRSGMLTLIHCEDFAVIRHLVDQMLASGHGGLANFPASRPPSTEEAAVARAIAFSEATNAPIYIVHVSSAPAVELISRARARGVLVSAEVRPVYLHLTESVFAGASPELFVGSPPIRGIADQERLWSGLQMGEMSTVGSDHAPWTLAEKTAPDQDIGNYRAGISELETMLPLLFDRGVLQGRIALEEFVRVSSTNAAKLLGLFPRKGTLQPGADADIVVWDPARRRVIRAAEGHSRAGHCPYEGWEITGWPTHVIRRGELICENGRLLPTSPGRLAMRQTTAIA